MVIFMLCLFVYRCMQPFAEVCMQHGNYREATKYIAKAAPENRFQLYMAVE